MKDKRLLRSVTGVQPEREPRDPFRTPVRAITPTPIQVIVPIDNIRQMAYNNWNLTHEQLLLQRYANHRALSRAVRNCMGKSFAHVSTRAEMAASLRNVMCDAPFSATVRFPETYFVKFTGTNIGELYDRVLAALDLETRMTEKGKADAITTTSSFSDASRAFTTSLIALERALTTIQVQQLQDNGVYNRATFELEYNLTWA